MHLPSLFCSCFSLNRSGGFLPDHAIYFIITHNEKMLNHFRIFFQKDQFFPAVFSISETYSFPSFLLFQTPQLFFLPVFTIFHQFPYFQAAQSHSFLLAGPCSRRYGKEILCAVICSSKMIISVEIFQQIRQFSIMCCCKTEHICTAQGSKHTL